VKWALVAALLGVGDEVSCSGRILDRDQHAHALGQLPLGLEATGIVGRARADMPLDSSMPAMS
jgi:hypothetical protein